jgi:hypothetical protein
MKPSVRQAFVSQVASTEAELTEKSRTTLIPAVFFVLGILLAASFLQGLGI